MKTVRTRKFAWVALVFALAMVSGPIVTQPTPTAAWPNTCWPWC